jgi:glutamate-1-semialdehyde 2,1-aminomutase
LTNTKSAFDYGKTYRERALKTLGYGASSTPRGNQKPAPIVTKQGRNAHITDQTGVRFIDYALGYGPLILGHSPACIMDALTHELSLGLRTASIHEGEAELAELLCDTLPCAEISAFVNSGSEANHLALRIARAVTGRNQVIKFRGNYHGWLDSLSFGNDVSSDGPATLGQDTSAAQSLTLLDWGDAKALADAITTEHAAVILEPAAINGGCIAPPAGFLEEVRAITKSHGVILIFDEVITGFRLSLGGAQQTYGVTPDIAVIGKAMGAGVPISAVTGSAAAMEPLATGRLLHRGTFNGNPLCVAAAIACIKYLRNNKDWLYDQIDSMAEDLRSHLSQAAAEQGIALSASRVGSALQVFVNTPQVQSLADTALVDRKATAAFAEELLIRNVQIIPRGLMYLSAAHNDADIEETKSAMTAAISAVKS